MVAMVGRPVVRTLLLDEPPQIYDDTPHYYTHGYQWLGTFNYSSY